MSLLMLRSLFLLYRKPVQNQLLYNMRIRQIRTLDTDVKDNPIEETCENDVPHAPTKYHVGLNEDGDLSHLTIWISDTTLEGTDHDFRSSPGLHESTSVYSDRTPSTCSIKI